MIFPIGYNRNIIPKSFNYFIFILFHIMYLQLCILYIYIDICNYIHIYICVYTHITTHPMILRLFLCRNFEEPGLLQRLPGSATGDERGPRWGGGRWVFCFRFHGKVTVGNPGTHGKSPFGVGRYHNMLEISMAMFNSKPLIFVDFIFFSMAMFKGKMFV